MAVSQPLRLRCVLCQGLADIDIFLMVDFESDGVPMGAGGIGRIADKARAVRIRTVPR